MLPDLILGRTAPSDMLAELVKVLYSTDEPDPDLCSEVGCGDLESLLRDHETALWPEVERLARTDIRFRRALASVWAYESPEFERRSALLAELGESHSVTVRFVVAPNDFAAMPRVSWRAVEVEGDPRGRQLGRLLREIADWYEREPLDGNPELSKNRSVFPHYYAWTKAAGALDRIGDQLAVAPDLATLRRLVRTAHGLSGPRQKLVGESGRPSWRASVQAVMSLR
jgi:hypothetical protein